MGLAAAALYMSCVKNNEYTTQRDIAEASNVVPVGDRGQGVMQSDVGTSIVLGDTAFINGQNAVGIEESDVGTSDADYIYSNGLVDFEVSGAQVGASYNIVIPLGTAVPEGAMVRKFIDSNVGWVDFVEAEGNSISSYTSADRTCPEPGSELWVPGLMEGATCLQLMIEDGGPNDTDLAADGTVTDPSAIGARARAWTCTTCGE